MLQIMVSFKDKWSPGISYLVQHYAVGNERLLSKETRLSVFSGVGCCSKIPVLILVSVRSLKFGVVPQILWPSTRKSGSTIGEKGREVEASRLRQNPRGLFAKAVNVGGLVVRVTFGLVNVTGDLEDDDVT